MMEEFESGKTGDQLQQARVKAFWQRESTYPITSYVFDKEKVILKTGVRDTT